MSLFVGIQKTPWCDQLYPQSIFSLCSGSLAQHGHGHSPGHRGASHRSLALFCDLFLALWHPDTLKPHTSWLSALLSTLCRVPFFMLTNSRSPPLRAFQGTLWPGSLLPLWPRLLSATSLCCSLTTGFSCALSGLTPLGSLPLHTPWTALPVCDCGLFPQISHCSPSLTALPLCDCGLTPRLHCAFFPEHHV